jgi:putative transcriptional regulator
MPDVEDDEVISNLETPTFLIAMPRVLDPFFYKSVVLLIEHQPAGALGLILNYPTQVAAEELLTGIDIDWRGSKDAKVHLGGPVQTHVGTMLIGDASSDERLEMSSIEIHPRIRLSQNIELLSELMDDLPDRIKIFLGYAGWGPSQLDKELERNDWLLAPVDPDLVFATEAPKIWEAALGSIGVRPDSLPSRNLTEPDEAN